MSGATENGRYLPAADSPRAANRSGRGVGAITASS